LLGNALHGIVNLLTILSDLSRDLISLALLPQ
jgi:hypothetical protein